jgi:hypothetical protein
MRGEQGKDGGAATLKRKVNSPNLDASRILH